MPPVYCEKSLDNLALRVRYTELHPEIPNIYDVDCSVYQSPNSRWPLPAELYLVFDESSRKILYFFTQMAKCKEASIYVVAHKSGSLDDYRADFDMRTFETCHQANKFFLSTLSEINHILDKPFVKITDKLFTFEQNFVMQNKVKLRRDSRKSFVVFGRNHTVDQLIQSMIGEPMTSHLSFGQESTFFGYPNRYAVKLAQSYLYTIKSILDERKTTNYSLNPLRRNRKAWGHFPVIPQVEYQEEKNNLSNPVYELSVLFHLLIPYFSSGDKNIRIGDRGAVERKQALLDALQSHEVARSHHGSRHDKIDVHLSLLDHPLMLVDRNSVFYHQVETCVEKTSNNLRLVSLLQFDQSADDDESRTDKFLLWHGTAVSNVYSILKNGFDLKRANHGLFGRGVYFADAVGKSQNYCHRGYDRCFEGLAFLLCEVKLGRVCDPHKSGGYDQLGNVKPDRSKYDSFVVKGKLEPNEEAYFKDDFGAKFYSQTLISNDERRRAREWGEFVVFDTNRIKVRYVVHCEYIGSRQVYF